MKTDRSTSLLRRSGSNQDYGVAVDTTNILRIEKGDMHSITMRVIGSQNDKVENLILTSKDGGGYSAYLAEYMLSSQELDALANGESLEAKMPSTLTNIQNAAKSNIENSGTDCVDVRTESENYCNDRDGNTIIDNGDNDGRCVSGWVRLEYTVLIIDVGCLSGSSGGDGDTGDTGDSGTGGPGGGSGGGGTDEDGNPIFTIPIVQATRNHVEELKKLTNRAEVKARINTLKAGVRTIALEQGTEFFTDYSGNENAPLIPEDQETGFDGVQFGPVYDNSFLRLHSHHSGLEPVFSADDVKEMAFFYKKKRQYGAVDANNITVMLVSDLGIFALRVSDPVMATKFSNMIVSGSFVNIFRLAYFKSVREKARLDCNCVAPSNELDKLLSNYLIDFLIEQKTGLTLYSGQLDANGNYTWIIHPKYNR